VQLESEGLDFGQEGDGRCPKIRAAADEYQAVAAMGCRCWLLECGETEAGAGMMESSGGEVGFSMCVLMSLNRYGRRSGCHRHQHSVLLWKELPGGRSQPIKPDRPAAYIKLKTWKVGDLKSM